MKLFNGIKEFIIEISGLKKQIKKLKAVNEYYKNALENEKSNRKYLESVLYQMPHSRKNKLSTEYSGSISK